jgi:general secretion pathway protein I
MSAFKQDSPHLINGQKGFVLIEIMVGVAILGIVMISAMRAISSAADTQLAISQRTLAVLSADNFLIDLRANRSWPELGSNVISCPQLKYLFVCQSRVMETPNPLFRRIEITVYEDGLSNQSQKQAVRLAWITTVVPNWGAGN